MDKEALKSIVINTIIANCKIELNSKDQQIYSLNEEQFGKCVDELLNKIRFKKLKCN